jgi:hypothetical protein
MSKSPTAPSAENFTTDPDIQRWTAKRKAAVVLDLIRGKTTAAETVRLYGLTVGEIERWREELPSFVRLRIVASLYGCRFAAGRSSPRVPKASAVTRAISPNSTKPNDRSSRPKSAS